MDTLNRPQPLVFSGNVAENWRVFQQEYEIYVAAAYSKIDKKRQSYILLNLAGHEAIERSKSFIYEEGESSEDPEVLIKKFSDLCRPQSNKTMERHKFNSRNQLPNEPFNAYLADLRIKASTCEYGTLNDELLCDRIVCGISSDAVRKLLLREDKSTLDKAIKICQVQELSENRVQQLQEPPKVDAVRRFHGAKPKTS